MCLKDSLLQKLVKTKTSNSIKSLTYEISWKTFLVYPPFFNKLHRANSVASFGTSILPSLGFSGVDSIG